jgi:hypothetical protein
VTLPGREAEGPENGQAKKELRELQDNRVRIFSIRLPYYRSIKIAFINSGVHIYTGKSICRVFKTHIHCRQGPDENS